MEQRKIKRLEPDRRASSGSAPGSSAPTGATVDAGRGAGRARGGVDHGVTFFDTADVYGDGRSERFCGELHRAHPEVFVATKMGRRVEQLTENYNPENFLAWNDRSRENLGHGDARSRAAALAARRRSF